MSPVLIGHAMVELTVLIGLNGDYNWINNEGDENGVNQFYCMCDLIPSAAYARLFSVWEFLFFRLFSHTLHGLYVSDVCRISKNWIESWINRRNNL